MHLPSCPLVEVRFTAPERPYLAGDLAPSTPLNGEAFLFSYPANGKVSDFLSDYLHKIAEAEIISHELVCHRTLSIFCCMNPAETLHTTIPPSFLVVLHLLPVAVHSLGIQAAQLAYDLP